MKRFILTASVVLAGCAAQTAQTPLQLSAGGSSGAAEPFPVAMLTNPRGLAGQFTVTLGNGDVLTGSFSTHPMPGPITNEAGPVLDNLLQNKVAVSMLAENAKESMRCTGIRTNVQLDVSCNLSDGSSYEGTQSYEDQSNGGTQ